MATSSEIEIIHFGDNQDIQAAAEAVYRNEEPGFQVDGVSDINELDLMLSILKYAAPTGNRHNARFNNAFFHQDTNGLGQKAHIDVSFQGLAVHQNIRGELPVTIATAQRWRSQLICPLDPACFEVPELVYNVRKGETIPGRLTVFSEGNAGGRDKPFRGLLPTVHFFDRASSPSEVAWTRYTTAESWIMHALLSRGKAIRTKKVAQQSFALLSEHITK